MQAPLWLANIFAKQRDTINPLMASHLCVLRPTVVPHILRTESIKIVKLVLCIVASLHQDKTESMVKVRSKGP